MQDVPKRVRTIHRRNLRFPECRQWLYERRHNLASNSVITILRKEKRKRVLDDERNAGQNFEIAHLLRSDQSDTGTG